MIPKINIRLQAGLILILNFLVFLFIGFTSFQIYFSNKIYPGVKVAGWLLANCSQKQAQDILQKIAENQNHIFKLEYENQNWEINLKNFNFRYLPRKTSLKAYYFGRSGSLRKNISEQISAFKNGVNLGFDYQINQDLLEDFIATLAAKIDLPAVPASIRLKPFSSSYQIEVKRGEAGRYLQQKMLLQEINYHLSYLQEKKLTLPVEKIEPQVSEEEAQQTKIRAEKLLGKNLILKTADKSWTLSDKNLIDFLAFKEDYSGEKIASFSNQLALEIDQPAQNALFKFLSEEGNQARVVEFQPAKNGRKLNQNETNKLIKMMLKQLEEKDVKELTLDLPLDLLEPQIKNENVNDFGIKELLGKGESWFFGSSASRIHNLQLASKKINGILVAPGETFSLNQALGDVSSQTGYQQAWIIKDGRTVLGDGGGVCQVSTTLFRAVLNAGLPVIERRAHAYRVSYYEQNYQVGVDATVFAPSSDFKFNNDTPAYILIQTFVDPVKMYARYELYGTWDGREVYISPSRIWDQTPPPPDLYQDDPTLPKGVIKQIDWAAWGAKTAFDWKVTRNGKILQERTFYSVYKPWQAVYLRGSGG